MEALSVRDYRNNLAASFTRADMGERVLIRRKNRIYALLSIGNEDLMLTPEMDKRIEEARAEYRAGKTLHFNDAASAIKWMNEL